MLFETSINTTSKQGGKTVTITANYMYNSKLHGTKDEKESGSGLASFAKKLELRILKYQDNSVQRAKQMTGKTRKLLIMTSERREA